MATAAVRIRSIMVATVLAGAALAWPTVAHATALPTVGGHPLVSDGSMTAWSGTSIGYLLANDSSTAGGVTVLGMRNDQAACASGATGAIEILRNDGTRWVPEQRIVHPEPLDGSSPSRPMTGCGGEFGESVSTDGTSIAVAARYVAGDDPTSVSTGAVYIYQRDSGSTWAKVARVRVPAGPQVDAVAVQGNRLAVSASTSSGSRVYMFARTSAGWQPDGDFAGRAPMAISGDQVLYASGPLGSGVSALFLAERTGGGWATTLNFRPHSVIGASGGFSTGSPCMASRRSSWTALLRR